MRNDVPARPSGFPNLNIYKYLKKAFQDAAIAFGATVITDERLQEASATLAALDALGSTRAEIRAAAFQAHAGVGCYSGFSVVDVIEGIKPTPPPSQPPRQPVTTVCELFQAAWLLEPLHESFMRDISTSLWLPPRTTIELGGLKDIRNAVEDTVVADIDALSQRRQLAADKAAARIGGEQGGGGGGGGGGSGAAAGSYTANDGTKQPQQQQQHAQPNASQLVDVLQSVVHLETADGLAQTLAGIVGHPEVVVRAIRPRLGPMLKSRPPSPTPTTVQPERAAAAAAAAAASGGGGGGSGMAVATTVAASAISGISSTPAPTLGSASYSSRQELDYSSLADIDGWEDVTVWYTLKGDPRGLVLETQLVLAELQASRGAAGDAGRRLRKWLRQATACRLAALQVSSAHPHSSSSSERKQPPSPAVVAAAAAAAAAAAGTSSSAGPGSSDAASNPYLDGHDGVAGGLKPHPHPAFPNMPFDGLDEWPYGKMVNLNFPGLQLVHRSDVTGSPIFIVNNFLSKEECEAILVKSSGLMYETSCCFRSLL